MRFTSERLYGSLWSILAQAVAAVWASESVASAVKTSVSKRSCFGVRLDGNVYTAESCCDIKKHGVGGDPRCWGWDEELGEEASFKRCCVSELLGERLLEDRPPLIVDFLLEVHPDVPSLWFQARELCTEQSPPCTRAEVFFSDLRLSPDGRQFLMSSEEEAPKRAIIDVGAHVQSQYLQKFQEDPHTVLFAFEPDRASLRYQRDFAERTLSPSALRRLWLLPAAVGLQPGLAVLNRANRFFDGQCSSLLAFRTDAVAWEGCTEGTGRDVVSTLPLAEILRRLPDSIQEVELKIDVQGFELQTIVSAGDELARVSKLKVELQDVRQGDPRMRYLGQHNKDEVVALLKDRGFKLASCDPYSNDAKLIKETDCYFERDEGYPHPLTSSISQSVVRAPALHLVTFADGTPFVEVQKLLDESAEQAGFASHAGWNFSSFLRSTAEFEVNPLNRIATPASTGDAQEFLPFNWRWWKPYVILVSLRNAAPGDWIVYQDSCSYVPKGFSADHAPALADLVKRLETLGSHALVGTVLPRSIGWEWKQRCVPNYSLGPDVANRVDQSSVVVAMCTALAHMAICPQKDAQCCIDFQERAMLQNSWMLWRKDTRSEELLMAWLRWNVDRMAMTAMPLADQSLLQILAHHEATRARADAGHTQDIFVVRPHLPSEPESKKKMGRRDSPVNQLKHLGNVLYAMGSASPEHVRARGEGGRHDLGGRHGGRTARTSGADGLPTVELVPLQELGAAAWHEGNTERAAWELSLCNE
eukprot:TRINITY_DN34936_c0_g1_i1.p1 TRINITY_DN34936_c0_g1~~TRINITY_DN34936_c0_g1_i1.p1  ORF type:complete len:759 (+),score=110.20 TRINITY_DN34936_c0_g1_i1:69-2345(+)